MRPTKTSRSLASATPVNLSQTLPRRRTDGQKKAHSRTWGSNPRLPFSPAPFKNILPCRKNVVLLQSISQGNHEALYLRLVFRKREKLPIMMQGRIMARANSVDCLPHLIIRVILTTSEIKKWYTAPRFLFIINRSTGCGRTLKLRPSRIRDKWMKNTIFTTIVLLFICSYGTSLMAQDTVILMNGSIIPTNKVEVSKKYVMYNGYRERKLYDGSIQIVDASVLKNKYQVREIHRADGSVQQISNAQSNILLAGSYLQKSANCQSWSFLSAIAGLTIASILLTNGTASDDKIGYLTAGITGFTSLTLFVVHIGKERKAGRVLEETYLLQ